MYKKSLKFVCFSAVGISACITCYYTGCYIERNRTINELKNYIPEIENLQRFKNYPILPLFGNVSAATAIVPYNKNETTTTVGARARQIMKFGYPSMDPESVKPLEDYVLCYDRRNRTAHWVFEHLTYDSIKHNDTVDRAKCEFKPDLSVHPFFRADNSDYKNSGYDRGHLAAAGNHRKCQKHCDETFLLSNMAPQVGKGFNRDIWNRLEKHVRKLTKIYANVYCCTGPLYLPKKENNGKMYVKYEVIGQNHVAVPTHFFKLVVGESADGKLDMESYVMPNECIPDETPLQLFQVPPESVERAAGFLFFNSITRNQLQKINGKHVH